VFLVLGPASGETQGSVDVAVDGKPVGKVDVSEHKLYELVSAPPTTARSHQLDLSFSPGVEAYAFTFGM
jgi:hypothetical protein